jgi:hypothetical protein
MIDNPHDTPNVFAVARGKEHDGVAMGERSVLFWIKILPLVRIDRRNPGRVIAVEFFRQKDEFLQVFPAFDFSEFNIHFSSFQGP